MDRRKPEDIRVENLLTDDPRTTLYRVVINVIDACNRSCSFCPRSDPDGYPNNPHNFMTLDSAERLSQTLADMNFKGVFSITGWGEPMLHKMIATIIWIFKNKNPEAKVELQTNGDTITKPKAERLKDAGLDRLVINLYDSADQAECFTRLLHTLPTSFWTMQHKYDKEKSYGMILNNRAGSFDGLPKLFMPLNKPCYMPFYKVAVDWNLDTYFCDYDWAKRILLGNLQTSSIEQLWMCDRMKEIRTALYKGDRNFTPCKYCDAEGVLYGKTQADIIMKAYENDTTS